jgi:hypothetical protein
MPYEADTEVTLLATGKEATQASEAHRMGAMRLSLDSLGAHLLPCREVAALCSSTACSGWDKHMAEA